MDDRLLSKTHVHKGATKLVASVTGDRFGRQLLEYISEAARIRNFGAFYVPDLRRVTPVLSVWSGRISDYWFRRNAADILTNELMQNELVRKIRAAPTDGVLIERWHPPPKDPRERIYARVKILERIGVTSRSGRGGFQSFFLRSVADGWLTQTDCARLEAVLPLAHELIGLRHRIVGSESFQFTSGISTSSLRERNVMAFATLSVREAEVCDCLVRGVSVAGTALELGIAESSVRTLRQRAYRKLGVTSATELMALMLHDHQLDSTTASNAVGSGRSI